MTPALAGPVDVHLSRLLPAAAAVLALVSLVGWMQPALREWTAWGAPAVTAPWTAVAILALAGAMLSRGAPALTLSALAGALAVAVLVAPEGVHAAQQRLWPGAPTRPAAGVGLAVLLLAASTWAGRSETLAGVSTAVAAATVAIVNLSLLGRLTGQAWLATAGDEQGPGAMSLPTVSMLLCLSMALWRERPVTGPLLVPVSGGTRRLTVTIAATIVFPLAVALTMPAPGPRAAEAYAITALLVVAATSAVQLGSLATDHRNALSSLTAVINVSPEPMLLVVDDHTILGGNDAVTATFGWPPEALPGLAFRRLVQLPDPAHGVGTAGGARHVDDESSEPARITLVAHRRDGTSFPAEVSLSRLQLRGVHAMVATVHDVSVHQEELHGLHDLEERRQMSMMALAHELRTPLTVITGVADTLRTHSGRLPPDRHRELVDRLSVHAQRLTHLVSELLDVERLRRASAKDRQRIDLGPLIEQQARVAAADHDLDVTVSVAPGLPRVDADPVLSARVVDNLLANAAKYASGPVEVHLTPFDAGVLLAVHDHGRGVPGPLRHKVFESFHRGEMANPDSPGVGIGLALVAGVAKTFGGRAWVQDRPDHAPGSSFRVYLPAALESD